MNLDLILLAVAFVCFLIDAVSERLALNPPLRLISLGLALWVLTLLI